MTDMLVKLYDLPEALPGSSSSAASEIKIRKPIGSEKSLLVQWVREKFGDFWANETDIAFPACRYPVALPSMKKK